MVRTENRSIFLNVSLFAVLLAALGSPYVAAPQSEVSFFSMTHNTEPGGVSETYVVTSRGALMRFPDEGGRISARLTSRQFESPAVPENPAMADLRITAGGRRVFGCHATRTAGGEALLYYDASNSIWVPVNIGIPKATSSCTGITASSSTVIISDAGQHQLILVAIPAANRDLEIGTPIPAYKVLILAPPQQMVLSGTTLYYLSNTQIRSLEIPNFGANPRLPDSTVELDSPALLPLGSTKSLSVMNGVLYLATEKGLFVFVPRTSYSPRKVVLGDPVSSRCEQIVTTWWQLVCLEGKTSIITVRDRPVPYNVTLEGPPEVRFKAFLDVLRAIKSAKGPILQQPFPAFAAARRNAIFTPGVVFPTNDTSWQKLLSPPELRVLASLLCNDMREDLNCADIYLSDRPETTDRLPAGLIRTKSSALETRERATQDLKGLLERYDTTTEAIQAAVGRESAARAERKWSSNLDTLLLSLEMNPVSNAALVRPGSFIRSTGQVVPESGKCASFLKDQLEPIPIPAPSVLITANPTPYVEALIGPEKAKGIVGKGIDGIKFAAPVVLKLELRSTVERIQSFPECRDFFQDRRLQLVRSVLVVPKDSSIDFVGGGEGPELLLRAVLENPQPIGEINTRSGAGILLRNELVIGMDVSPEKLLKPKDAFVELEHFVWQFPILANPALIKNVQSTLPGIGFASLEGATPQETDPRDWDPKPKEITEKDFADSQRWIITNNGGSAGSVNKKEAQVVIALVEDNDHTDDGFTVFDQDRPIWVGDAPPPPDSRCRLATCGHGTWILSMMKGKYALDKELASHLGISFVDASPQLSKKDLNTAISDNEVRIFSISQKYRSLDSDIQQILAQPKDALYIASVDDNPPDGKLELWSGNISPFVSYLNEAKFRQNVLTVGAADRNRGLTPWGGRGARYLELIAPGKDIPGLAANGKLSTRSGTSAGPPQVALAAARIAIAGDLKSAKARLLYTADPVDTSTRCEDYPEVFFGHLNSRRAVDLEPDLVIFPGMEDIEFRTEVLRRRLPARTLEFITITEGLEVSPGCNNVKNEKVYIKDLLRVTSTNPTQNKFRIIFLKGNELRVVDSARITGMITFDVRDFRDLREVVKAEPSVVNAEPGAVKAEKPKSLKQTLTVTIDISELKDFTHNSKDLPFEITFFPFHK